MDMSFLSAIMREVGSKIPSIPLVPAQISFTVGWPQVAAEISRAGTTAQLALCFYLTACSSSEQRVRVPVG